MQSELRRPLAAITGASSGIGYELAKVFANNGFDLIICAEDPGIADVGNAFRAMGAKVETVRTDLATYEGVDVLVRKINELRDQDRPLEALAVNTCIGESGEFVHMDLHDEIRMINLNVISAIHLTKHILPQFISRGHGRLLFTTCSAIDVHGPHYAVYAASEAFIHSFSEAIRNEVKDYGVTVTALQTGISDTARIAKDGFDAMMEGRDHAIAGTWINNIQSVMAKIMPETQSAALHGSETKRRSD